MPVWVGLKYCGGCTPRFDRVALFERIRESVSGHVRFIPCHDPRAGHVLIITGCPTACVDQAPFEGKEIFLVSKEDDEGPVVAKLMALESDSGGPPGGPDFENLDKRKGK